MDLWVCCVRPCTVYRTHGHTDDGEVCYRYEKLRLGLIIGEWVLNVSGAGDVLHVAGRWADSPPATPPLLSAAPVRDGAPDIAHGTLALSLRVLAGSNVELQEEVAWQESRSETTLESKNENKMCLLHT
ncbi:hypothetical protein OYC64_002166 [Pagothenia borchgrevinki]|uniref:Uncharacterized protein n=1 Tax=Pagothenia borchgrevinki TaxID=8213 RepID=A0ABD2H715_PAGBO